MMRTYFLIPLLLITTSICAMYSHLKIRKCDPRAKKITQALCTKSSDLKKKSLNVESKFLVNCADIIQVTTELVHSPDGDATGYEATLKDGSQISCFYLLNGPYAQETWALLWPAGEGKPVTISSIHYYLIRELYERTASSIFIDHVAHK